jgi:F-type H+-transporting ATPase subunit beta
MPTTTPAKTATKKGRIIQIVGVVVDIEFDNHLPGIYNALSVDTDKGLLMLEVAQHLS